MFNAPEPPETARPMTFVAMPGMDEGMKDTVPSMAEIAVEV